MSLPLDLIDADQDRVWYSLAQTEYFNHYGLMQTDRHKMQFPVKDFPLDTEISPAGLGLYDERRE